MPRQSFSERVSFTLEEVGNSKIGMGSFAATQARIGTKDHFSREKEGQASPGTLPQIAEVEVT
jgi:hypothetical protein